MIVFIVFFSPRLSKATVRFGWIYVGALYNTHKLCVCVYLRIKEKKHEETALNLLGMRDKETETHMHRRDNLLRAAAGAHRCRLSRPIALWCLRKRERILLENFNIPLLHPSPPAVICF